MKYGTTQAHYAVSLLLVLTVTAVFPCVSDDTITVEIIHSICAISTIPTWLSSTVTIIYEDKKTII